MTARTDRVIKSRSIIYAPNRDKSLRGDAQRTRFKTPRAVVSYDQEKWLAHWLQQVSIRNSNEVSNG